MTVAIYIRACHVTWCSVGDEMDRFSPSNKLILYSHSSGWGPALGMVVQGSGPTSLDLQYLYSGVGVSKASAFRFISWTVCSSYPTLNLYGDRAFPVAAVRIWNSLPQHITLLRHFPSSVVAWRHTSSKFVTRNYCCRPREVTLSFMDALIALTY